VNRGNGLAGPRVAAGRVKAVRRTVAAEEGMETTASGQPLRTAADDDLTLGLLGSEASQHQAEGAHGAPGCDLPRSGPGPTPAVA